MEWWEGIIYLFIYLFRSIDFVAVGHASKISGKSLRGSDI
jgi:hypothetical protein